MDEISDTTCSKVRGWSRAYKKTRFPSKFDCLAVKYVCGTKGQVQLWPLIPLHPPRGQILSALSLFPVKARGAKLCLLRSCVDESKGHSREEGGDSLAPQEAGQGTCWTLANRINSGDHVCFLPPLCSLEYWTQGQIEDCEWTWGSRAWLLLEGTQTKTHGQSVPVLLLVAGGYLATCF